MLHAETDLLDIMGINKAPSGRGGSVKLTKVNLINTFKCSYGGVNLEAKALRWAQARFNDIASALYQWKNSVHPALVLKGLTRGRSLCQATYSCGKLHSHFLQTQIKIVLVK